MDLGLAGRVAIVTGASRGIGAGIARALAAEGCRLVLCARGRPDLERTAAELSEAGAEVEAIPLDVTAADAGDHLAAAALDRFGRLDILVANAGGNRRGTFEEVGDEDWDSLIELNLMSHVRCARAVLPAMRRCKSGVILFIASIFGREAGGAGLTIYNATKSALISLAKILSLEVAADGIRVNSVAPGSILFPGGSWDQRARRDPAWIADFVTRNLPLGRFGTVEEVANVVAFLASDRASLVTGACWTVDGGQSRSLI